MIRSRVLRRTVTFVLVALAAASAIWLTRPREPKLMDRATPLPQVSSHFASETYFWLSTASILNVSGSKPPLVIDARTAATSTLPRFKPDVSYATSPQDENRFEAQAFCSLSPDARWLVCPGGGLSLAYSLDGKRTVEWTVSGQHAPIMGSPVWIDDNQLILLPETGAPDEVAYWCDLDKAGPAKPVHLSRTIDQRQVGVLPDHSVRFIPTFFSDVPDDKVAFTDLKIDGKSGELKNGLFGLPRRSCVDLMVFSPDRRRIAWGLECNRDLQGSDWYVRLQRLIGMHARRTWELWTSDYRGNDWRLRGVVDDPQMSTQPYALQWTPDGSRISFLVRKTLYTVQAD